MVKIENFSNLASGDAFNIILWFWSLFFLTLVTLISVMMPGYQEREEMTKEGKTVIVPYYNWAKYGFIVIFSLLSILFLYWLGSNADLKLTW